jgi:sorbitol-specific phosphotransferase system component IIA
VFAELYQNTSFTINEYWSIGQVANLVNDNGANTIHITLTDGAIWEVTGTSLIHSLTISGDSSVIIPEGVTLTVNGTDYTACTLMAGSY